MTGLEIIYQDHHYIAVYKPAGVFVHRSKLGSDGATLMSLLRNQLKEWVFPIHRLDRPTAGLILFGRSSQAAASASQLFRERQVEKTYLAVVRGFPPQELQIDHSLCKEPGAERRPAQTGFRRLATVQLDMPVGKWPTARLALMEVKPKTGRRHQIRKHCNHMAHPIPGDAVYGDRYYNRLIRESFGLFRLLLVSVGLSFYHPFTGELLELSCQPDDELLSLFHRFGWGDPFRNSDPQGRIIG